MAPPSKGNPFSLSLILAFLLVLSRPSESWPLASNNIPIDSPVYSWLDKLASFGMIKSDFKGIRPFSKAEAARLLAEAEENRTGEGDVSGGPFVDGILSELRQYLAREASLRDNAENAPRFAVRPVSGARLRYVYLEGTPRSYERPVHDPGGDRLFGITDTLRPDNPYPSPTVGHGSEGTPLFENNEGIVYTKGHNLEFRLAGEAFAGGFASALLEPLVIHSTEGDDSRLLLNKGYLKVGGGGVELELGRDANWFGFGLRGNGILTNNARNFDLVKLSSPEPIDLKYIGAIKYAFIFSRFEGTVTDGRERQPYFFGAKLSVKPCRHFEGGLSLGRQQGGPGVSNSLGEWFRGLWGGTDDDNSNSVAAFEFRIRLPFLRNSEIYFEDTFEDLPSAESYVTGFFIPRLTEDGKNDLRFEYFRGHNILYTNTSTFPQGYNYKGMPVGHSQGGATEDFFVRLGHWFSARNRLALDYIHTERGGFGRVPVNSSGAFDANGTMQAIERKNGWRISWEIPIAKELELGLMYGWERIENFNLVGGDDRTNQIGKVDLAWRY